LPPLLLECPVVRLEAFADGLQCVGGEEVSLLLLPLGLTGFYLQDMIHLTL